MTHSTHKVRRSLPDDHTLAELDPIATQALAEGDEYSRLLLRDQLIGQEIAEPPLDETWKSPLR